MKRSERRRPRELRAIPYWRKVRLDEDLRHLLDGSFVAVTRDGKGKLLRHEHTWWGGIRLTTWVPDGGGKMTHQRLRRKTKLSDHLHQGHTVCSAPPWTMPRSSEFLRWLVPILLSAALMGAMIWVGLTSWALLLPMCLGVIAHLNLPSFGVSHMQSLASLPLDGHAAIEYAANRLAGVHPEALEEGPRRARVQERIDAIRTRYVELREDVVVRIDQPALFDAAAPTTADLLAAFVLADDIDDATPLAEMERIAGEVEIAFATAQRHAERVGIDHLPEASRADARRASKTARLVRDGATEGERRAAREQLGRILDAMGLAHLPSPKEIRAIEG